MTRSCSDPAVALLALFVALCVASPRRAHAQLEQDCVRELVDALPEAGLGGWSGHRPGDLRKRFAPLRAAGRWSAIADSLGAIYLAVGRPAAGSWPPSSVAGLSADEQTALRAELDSLKAELSAAERDRRVMVSGAVTVIRFSLTPPRPVGEESYTLFKGRRTTPVVVTERLPADTRRSVCWLALAAQDVATQVGDEARRLLTRALNARVERWDNFSQRGYSMLPHELLLNGLLVPRRDLEPPRMQLVIAHPTAGAEMAGETLALSKLKRLDVLALEPAGLLVYGPQNRWYAGASLVVTFPGSANAGAGVMAHLGPLGRAAYVWHGRDEEGRRRRGVLLSLDFYRYLTGAAERWKKIKEESVADCLKDAQACVAAMP